MDEGQRESSKKKRTSLHLRQALTESAVSETHARQRSEEESTGSQVAERDDTEEAV